MGRKSAIKKKKGSRNEFYKMLRDGGTREKIIIGKGNEVAINPLKHLLMNDTYKNDDMNRYMAQVLKQYKAFIEQVKAEKAATQEVDYEVLKDEEEKQSS